MAANSNKPADFSAAESALGYLYQVRLALLSSLKRLAADETFAVYLETLDDVVFDRDGLALDLLQLKHHCERAANLTDASPNLWKTLRVWMEGRASGTIPSDAQHFLITTSDIGLGSAAAMLGSEGRNEAEALKRLDHTATTSENDTNKLAYALFRALPEPERKNLVASVVIVPRAPTIRGGMAPRIRAATEAPPRTSRGHMSVIPWTERTIEEARLLNPAFLGALLWCCVSSAPSPLSDYWPLTTQPTHLMAHGHRLGVGPALRCSTGRMKRRVCIEELGG